MLVLHLFCCAALLPGADLFLRNVTYIDVTGARQPHRTSLWISGSRIQAQGPSLPAPATADRIDAEGKYLIPGLWDAHVHLVRDDSDPTPLLRQFLDHGVTAVRDMGSIPDRIVALRHSIASGRIEGPQLLVCGAMLDGPPSKAGPTVQIVSSGAEAAAAVDRFADRKVDFIKVQQNLSAESYRAIVEAAKQRKLPVMGHTPDAIAVTDAVRAGQRTIEHLTGVLVACSSREAELRSHIAKGAIGVDFGPIGEPGRIALDSYSEQKAATLFRSWKGVYMLPTLVWEKAFLLAPSTRRRPETSAMMQEHFAKGMAIVKAMHSAGIPIAAGTDAGDEFTTPGLGLHRELELLVEAGLTPLQALQSATIHPAAMMKRPLPITDFVLLDENPLHDIRNTRRIQAVIRNGRIVARHNSMR